MSVRKENLDAWRRGGRGGKRYLSSLKVQIQSLILFLISLHNPHIHRQCSRGGRTIYPTTTTNCWAPAITSRKGISHKIRVLFFIIHHCLERAYLLCFGLLFLQRRYIQNGSINEKYALFLFQKRTAWDKVRPSLKGTFPLLCCPAHKYDFLCKHYSAFEVPDMGSKPDNGQSSSVCSVSTLPPGTLQRLLAGTVDLGCH